MKYLIFYIFLTIIFISCTKNGSPVTPPPEQDSLLKSYTLYYPISHTKTVQEFRYDSSKHLAGIYTYKYDSTGGIPGVDSIFMVFSLLGQPAPPSSYNLTSFKAGYTAHHLTFYDDLNRMMRDSMNTTTGPYLINLFMRYDDHNNTLVEWYTKTSWAAGAYNLEQIDTLHIENENILTEVIYSHGTFYWTRNFTPSAQISPVYNEQVAKALGVMIYVTGLGDYRSRNLPAHMTDTVVGYGSRDLHYNWSTDAAGRVVQGTVTNPDQQVVEIDSFLYNH